MLSLVLGMISYEWWLGPKAEPAKLQPLVVDAKLAKKLPRNWVFYNGAKFEAYGLLSRGYADRVFNAPGFETLAPEERRNAFLEELKLIKSPSCDLLIASGKRDANAIIQCVKRIAVNASDFDASQQYLTERSDEDYKGTRSHIYVFVDDGAAKSIARCIGTAPREGNPFLAMIRQDRSLEVASSIGKCRKRAISGGLSRAVATGATE